MSARSARLARADGGRPDGQRARSNPLSWEICARSRPHGLVRCRSCSRLRIVGASAIGLGALDAHLTARWEPSLRGIGTSRPREVPIEVSIHASQARRDRPVEVAIGTSRLRELASRASSATSRAGEVSSGRSRHRSQSVAMRGAIHGGPQRLRVEARHHRALHDDRRHRPRAVDRAHPRHRCGALLHVTIVERDASRREPAPRPRARRAPPRRVDRHPHLRALRGRRRGHRSRAARQQEEHHEDASSHAATLPVLPTRCGNQSPRTHEGGPAGAEPPSS